MVGFYNLIKEGIKMVLELEKSSHTKWTIKIEDLESFAITTLEQNSELKSINFSQSQSQMQFTEFVQYYEYITGIMENIELKYKINPILTPFQFTDKNKVRDSGKSQHTPIISLKTQDNFDTPELYIIAKNGLCLFHFEFFGKIKEKPIDQNLVSGLVSAINSFVENLGWTKGLNLVRSGDTELRFSKSENIIVALLTHVDMKFSYLVEQILVDLASDLGNTFEENYLDELQECAETGISDTEVFVNFKEVVSDFFIKYRKQTFELYQKLILTESLYLGIDTDLCSNLIHQISEGKSVIGELSDMMKQYPIIEKVIEKVNNKQEPMWKIFNIPIFEF